MLSKFLSALFKGGAKTVAKGIPTKIAGYTLPGTQRVAYMSKAAKVARFRWPALQRGVAKSLARAQGRSRAWFFCHTFHPNPATSKAGMLYDALMLHQAPTVSVFRSLGRAAGRVVGKLFTAWCWLDIADVIATISLGPEWSVWRQADILVTRLFGARHPILSDASQARFCQIIGTYDPRPQATPYGPHPAIDVFADPGYSDQIYLASPLTGKATYRRGRYEGFFVNIVSDHDPKIRVTFLHMDPTHTFNKVKGSTFGTTFKSKGITSADAMLEQTFDVQAGDILGAMGSTGENVVGRHVHVVLNENGVDSPHVAGLVRNIKVNPYYIINSFMPADDPWFRHFCGKVVANKNIEPSVSAFSRIIIEKARDAGSTEGGSFIPPAGTPSLSLKIAHELFGAEAGETPVSMSNVPTLAGLLSGIEKLKVECGVDDRFSIFTSNLSEVAAYVSKSWTEPAKVSEGGDTFFDALVASSLSAIGGLAQTVVARRTGPVNQVYLNADGVWVRSNSYLRSVPLPYIDVHSDEERTFNELVLAVKRYVPDAFIKSVNLLRTDEDKFDAVLTFAVESGIMKKPEIITALALRVPPVSAWSAYDDIDLPSDSTLRLRLEQDILRDELIADDIKIPITEI